MMLDEAAAQIADRCAEALRRLADVMREAQGDGAGDEAVRAWVYRRLRHTGQRMRSAAAEMDAEHVKTCIGCTQRQAVCQGTADVFTELAARMPGLTPDLQYVMITVTAEYADAESIRQMRNAQEDPRMQMLSAAIALQEGRVQG